MVPTAGPRMLGSFYRFVGLRVTQGGPARLVHSQNPLTCLLELLLYLTVGYLLAAKAIRALLRRLCMSQHARDRCAEATLLGVSSAVCLFLCWTQLRPSRDVFRRENSLVGVFTHNRLFDENVADSTNSRAVFALVSALLLHAAGVTWYNQGLDLQVVKKTAFFAFYVTARNLRFKCLGSAATMIVTLTELLLQLTRVVCCIERKRSYKAPVLTYLSFSTYVTAWVAVFAGVLPWFFLRPCLRLDAPLARMPSMCFLCGSLLVFYLVELATMPLLWVLKQWVLPTPSLVVCGQLERVLIPPPERVLRELRELHAMRMRVRAEREEFDRRHGSCKKTRDVYKSLKMILAVKRRIRNFRQAKLSSAAEESASSSSTSEPSDDLQWSTRLADTASETGSDLRLSSAPGGTASKIAGGLDLSTHRQDTAGEIPGDLNLSPAPEGTASEIPGDIHLSSHQQGTASETGSDLHVSTHRQDTASEIPGDLHLFPAPEASR